MWEINVLTYFKVVCGTGLEERNKSANSVCEELQMEIQSGYLPTKNRRAVIIIFENDFIEQVGSACNASSLNSVGTPTILTEGFHDFVQFLHANARVVPHLDQDRFLPHPFQFIIH
jgi:hypothetical protein